MSSPPACSHQATGGELYSRIAQSCARLTGQTSGLPQIQSYELAYTPALLSDIFAGRATDALMDEGRYVHRDDTDWWVPSGRWEYLTGAETLADARGRFFAAI